MIGVIRRWKRMSYCFLKNSTPVPHTPCVRLIISVLCQVSPHNHESDDKRKRDERYHHRASHT